MKRITSHPGLGSFTVSLLLAGLVGLAFSTPAQAAKKDKDVAKFSFGRILADPKSPIPGKRFKLKVTMWNKGKGNAVRFRVDAISVSGGKSVGKAVFPELKSGGRATRAIALTYPGNPGAAPKRYCVELLINRLKNVNAVMDKAEPFCVSAKAVAKPSKKPEKPSARPPVKTARERSSSREETPRARAALPSLGPPVAPKGPIEIKIASLDILRDKFALELENKDKDRGLRSPLVVVEINQAGKKTRIYRKRLTSIPADGTRLLRIKVPKGAKSTDFLVVTVNKGVIGRKGLRGLLDEKMLADLKVPAVKKLGKGKLGKKGKPFKLPANLQPLMLITENLRVNDELGRPDPVSVAVGATADVTWTPPTEPGPTGATADGIYLRVRTTPFPPGEICSDDASAMNAEDDFPNPDSAYRPGSSYPLTLTDPAYTPDNTYYVMGCFWNRDTRYTGDWTNVVEVRYGGAGGFIGWVPERVVDAFIRGAELRIDPYVVDVDLVPGYSQALVGQNLEMGFTVVNEGTAAARVYPAVVGSDVRNRVKRVGETVAIDPGESVRVSFVLKVTRDKVRGTRTSGWHFRSYVFLADADKHGGIFDVYFRDSDPDNHAITVHRRIPGYLGTPTPEYYRVNAWLRSIDVHADCDSASPGDWLLKVTVDYPGIYSLSLRGESRDSWWGPRDVSTGSSWIIDNRFRMMMPPGENLRISIVGVDCDIHGFDFRGAREWNSRCGGEEELGDAWSGTHDWAGRADLTLTPEQWIRGGTYEVRSSMARIRDPGSLCDAPSAFTAHFEIEPAFY